MRNGAYRLHEIFCPEVALVLFMANRFISNGVDWIRLGLGGATSDLLGSAFLAASVFVAAVAIVKNYRRIPADFIYLSLFVGFAYLLSIVANVDTYREVMRQGLLRTTFFDGLTTYLLVRMTRDRGYIWKGIGVASWVVLMLSVVAFAVYDVGHVYRTYASGMLFATAYFMVEWLYEDRRLMAAPSALGIILSAIGGRRSSLASLLILYVLICANRRRYRLILLGVTLFAAVGVFWDQIISFFINISTTFDINSRVLRRLMTGAISDDSHRFEQWSYVFTLLSKDVGTLLGGLGIAGERHYMLAHFLHMELSGYPHNVNVEMIGHFGVILGPLIEVFTFLVWPVRSFKKANDANDKKILIYAMTLSSTLLFQGSYLQNKSFFLYLGCLACILLGDWGSTDARRRNIDLSQSIQLWGGPADVRPAVEHGGKRR